MNRSSDSNTTRQNNNLIVAVLLIGAGLVSLLVNSVQLDKNVGLLVLPAIGVAMLISGLYVGRSRMAAVGSLLTGLGVGIYVSQQLPDAPGKSVGGIIVLGLALGFLGIMAVHVRFREPRAWWPAIPGAILAIVGILLTIGTDEAMNTLEFIGRYWPVLHVLLGIYLLVNPRRHHHEH